MSMTGYLPGVRSSSGRKVLPKAGCTPSIEKKFPETSWPQTTCGFPSGTAPAGFIAADISCRVDRLDKCFNRDTWPELRFFALVLPDDDIFPVRAPFDSKDRKHLNIADSRFSSEKPVCYAGPDIVASIIRTGRVPNVLKAIRVTP